MALTILDRLVEEKIAFAATNATTDNTDNTNTNTIDNNNNYDDDDFRTIDVSLVHAFLKQWKDCLHKSSTSNNNSRQHGRHHHDQQQQHHQQQHHQGDVFLPSQLLQKIDDWVSASASDCSASPLLEPNIATYTLLMDGAVSCHQYQESTGFCEALIERLFRESNSNNKLKPTMVTMGIFLRALANHKTVESAELAESWLRKIPDLLAPDGDNANNNANNSDNEKAVVAAKVRPNTVVYTTVIQAWASLGRADRAEDLLREMCEEYHHYCCNHGNNIGGNDINNNNNNNYYFRRDEDETAAAVAAAKPNLWTFNTVLAAWSRSRDPGAIQKAESLLRTMESLSLSSNSKTRNVQDLENNNNNGSGSPTTTATTTTNTKNNFSDSNGLDRSNPFEKPSSSSSSSSLAFKLDVAPTIVSYNSLMSTIASRPTQRISLARAESLMEEILGKANVAATKTATKRGGLTSAVVGNIGSKLALRRNNSNSNSNHYSRRDGNKKNDSSLVPNLITYEALFYILFAAGDLSDCEKADRMRYWLARSRSKSLQNHPSLLEPIHALESKEPSIHKYER